MTETTDARPPVAPIRPPLRRSRDNRVIGGVCGGFAEYLGIDPVLVRVVLVVLAIFGGGVLLYLAAWLLIPEAGRDDSAAQQLFGGANTSTAVVVILAIAIGLAVVLATSAGWFGVGPDFGGPGFLLLLATVALVVWLVRRDRQPPAAQPYRPDAPAVDPAAVGPVPVAPTPTDAKPKPPRSVLGLLTISAAALVAGGLTTAAFIVDDSPFHATTILGAALAVIGLGLLVGTFVGRSRWLILLGVVLVVATSISAATSSLGFSGGVGERTWRPTTASEAATDYNLGLGSATLDLRGLDLHNQSIVEPVTASVGVGELKVLLPTDGLVLLNGQISLGEIVLPDQRSVGGTDNDVHTVIELGDATDSVTLDLEVGIGQLTVRSEPLFVPSTPSELSLTQGALR